jgi:Ca2+-binding RTX toxin-like protein
MAYYAYNSNVVAGGIRHHLASGDTVNIGVNGYLGSSDWNALQGNGVFGVRVVVLGSLVAAQSALDFRNQMPNSLTTVVVGPSGQIDSGAFGGFQYFGDGLALSNAGVISGGFSLIIQSTSGMPNRITNTGTIGADPGQAALYIHGTGVVEIVNTGHVGTNSNSFALATIDTDTVSISIVNRGLIAGGLQLASGADRVDARGGEILGQILFDGGDDTFLPGLGEETVSGGLGRDTLDFRGEGAVVVALDGSLEGTGRAAGDTYAEFEEILGSVRADVLVGDGGANFLFGRGGADTLSGGAGSDTLRGGIGGDRLTGGQGNDAFAYGTVFEGGDVIVDFGRVTGNDDRFLISALLGGGLAVGALPGAAFAAVADLGAIAGDDRLIFRTTDTTVWFDADGAGGAAAVLLADLQAGAVVTAADFTVY